MIIYMSEFKCEYCNYNTNTKANFDKHLNTKKHIKNKGVNNKKYICKYCGTCVSFRSGLSKHSKSCDEHLNKVKELELELSKLKELKELKENEIKEMNDHQRELELKLSHVTEINELQKDLEKQQNDIEHHKTEKERLFDIIKSFS